MLKLCELCASHFYWGLYFRFNGTSSLADGALQKRGNKKYRLILLFEIILKHRRSHKKTQGPRV